METMVKEKRMGGEGEDLLLGAWLGRGMPVELDLGCHRGRFVVAMAAEHADRIFIGIERQAGRVAKCLRKIERLNLANATVVQGECLDVVERLAPASVDAIHLSFPDPWPKRRHQARRLVTPSFIEAAWRALRGGGALRLMTDDADYFASMQAAVGARGAWREVGWNNGREYPATEFERKFLECGKPVYRLALARCDASSSK